MHYLVVWTKPTPCCRERIIFPFLKHDYPSMHMALLLWKNNAHDESLTFKFCGSIEIPKRQGTFILYCSVLIKAPFTYKTNLRNLGKILAAKLRFLIVVCTLLAFVQTKIIFERFIITICFFISLYVLCPLTQLSLRIIHDFHSCSRNHMINIVLYQFKSLLTIADKHSVGVFSPWVFANSAHRYSSAQLVATFGPLAYGSFANLSKIILR